ncbi:MAG TPA: hypothetical protein VMJ10_28945 [Kofleriaceae bacterium]|nr:hypothetical protein [Kofleriaceae bacterium]
MRDLLVPATSEVLAIDALDDRRLGIVDDRDRETSAEAVALALERVAVAGAAGDAPCADAAAQTFARARANGLELHLVPGALDERGRLVDGVREHDLLAARVVEEPARAIAHEVAHDERDLDRVTAEARLVAAHDHVSALGVGEKLA